MTQGQQKQSEFLDALYQSLETQDFVKLSLALYKGAEENLKSIHIKKILIKRQEKLSFTYRYKTRDIVKNYDVSVALQKISKALQNDFQMATLMTTAFDLILETQGKQKLRRQDPSQKTPPSLDHDRPKNRPLMARGQSYLYDLKITDAEGQVLKSAQDKFRQINKYIEILDGLVKTLPVQGRPLHIVDMGAGKGYLTFALADHVQNTLARSAEITGVEFRADLVELCNGIAQKSGLDHLRFVEGKIESFTAQNLDVLIALHACNTATDDAIAKGIKAGAELIVVAPCCHKQIRAEMEKGRCASDLDFLLRYGIFMERQAEMVTDGLRALILNYFGYTTKVFEFISDAHTPKNVMIVGAKSKKSQGSDPKILKEIQDAKKFFGIEQHYLEKLLEI